MSESIQYWATTNAGNANSDPAIASSDTQAPNTVATNIRSIMTALAKARLDVFGGLTAGGTANALTVTTNQVLISAQLTGGAALMIKAAATNTSAAVTFAPDGLTVAPVKRADGTALAVGSIQAGMFLLLVYSSGTQEWWAANILPQAVVSGGAVNVGSALLTSGSWSAQATGDINLSAYVTGYRGFKIVLYDLVPAANAVSLSMRTSSNGGGTYDSGAANYSWQTSSFLAAASNNSDTLMSIAGGASSPTIPNTSTYGVQSEITIMDPMAAFYTKVQSNSMFISSTPGASYYFSAGARLTTAGVNAVRFFFSSGNISSGSYAVYGLI
jgi:hypothetical protein